MLDKSLQEDTFGLSMYFDLNRKIKFVNVNIERNVKGL